MSKWVEWQEVDPTGRFLATMSFPLDGDYPTNNPNNTRLWNYKDEWEWIEHISNLSSSTWIYRVLDNGNV